MSIGVGRGTPLGVFSIEQSGKHVKIDNAQQRELTRQLCYRCGKKRELHNHPSKNLRIPEEGAHI